MTDKDKITELEREVERLKLPFANPQRDMQHALLVTENRELKHHNAKLVEALEAAKATLDLIDSTYERLLVEQINEALSLTPANIDEVKKPMDITKLLPKEQAVKDAGQMKNPHYIVGPENMCLCGSYNGEPISCNQIRIAIRDIFAKPFDRDSRLLARVLMPLVADMDADEVKKEKD